MENMTQFLDTYAPLFIGSWTKWISLGAGIMTLLMFVAIQIANKKHDTFREFQNLIYGLIFIAPSFYYEPPMFWKSMTYIFIVHALLYPLLLTRKAKFFTYLYTPLAVLFSVGYLAALLYTRHYEGAEFYWRTGLLVLWFAFCYFMIWLINGLVQNHTCPHCGYCACNQQIKTPEEEDDNDDYRYMYLKCEDCGKTYKVKLGKKVKPAEPRTE